MRKLLAVLAGLAMSLAVATVSGADKLKVGFIYVGPIGDHGWTYQHHEGLLAVEEAFGDKVETVYVENVAEGPGRRTRDHPPRPPRAPGSSSPPRSATWTRPSRWPRTSRT